MLGTDFELFFIEDDHCLPAIPAFLRSGYGSRMAEKVVDLPTDIAPDGYTTYVLPYQHGTVIEDGAAVECPCDPSDSAADLVDYVRGGIQATWKIADACGVDLQATPLVNLKLEHIETRPELRVLGCSPDIDLYGLFEGTPPQDPRNTTWRTGGGHIHFSPDDIFDPLKTQAIVMLCDLLLGTADVALEHSDGGRKRREMYGQPGKHRIQPWGVEYRTMSNVWTVHPDVALAVLGLASAVHEVMDSGDWQLVFDLAEKFRLYDVTDAILVCDSKTCLSTAVGVSEALAAHDYDTSAISLVKDIAESGGVVSNYGYSLGGWR